MKTETKHTKEPLGCGNHGCRLQKPIGQATNGPCSCLDGLRAENKVKVLSTLAALRRERDEAVEALRACVDCQDEREATAFNTRYDAACHNARSVLAKLERGSK